MRIAASLHNILAAIIAFLGTTAAGATIFFAVPNATGTFAQGINNAGLVVGTYVLNGQEHAFVRNADGSLEFFDAPDAVSTAANGINDSGQICGTYTTGNGAGQVHGFIRNADRSFITFDVPGALTTYAWGINNAGSVAGDYFFDSGQYRAFSRTADGVFTTFDAPNAPAGNTFALGINNSGEIVGGSGMFSYLRSADSQTFVEFNSPSANSSGAFGVNDADFIVGSFEVPIFGNQLFQRTPDGVFIEFNICVSCNTTVGGINNSGVMVGNTFNISSDAPSVAYIGTIQDLTLTGTDALMRSAISTVSKVTSAPRVKVSVARTATRIAPNISPSPNVIAAAAGANRTKPFGAIDTPIDGAINVSGAIPVSGWALDSIEVVSVDVWREPVSGESSSSNGLVYVGDAAFVSGARPDVQSAFPNLPFNDRGGWCYQLLTNFLPNAAGSGPSGNGIYKLHAIARNKAGASLDLGAKTITVDNAHAAKPFGAIDTPGHGGTPSGSAYPIFGWALTQNPNIIPIDGSTITVLVDGQVLGHPAYNNSRSDIATLFPGYRNSGGAVGFYYLDTTKLANGVHTISWNVFDNVGHGDSIGSRYFNVFNSAGSVAAREQETMEPAKIGSGLLVEIQEMGHVEIPVGAAGGYQLVNGKRVPLPIGSSLKRGVFYWQPGPGFLGEYNLVFAQLDGTEVSVHVKIGPKTYIRPTAK
jgi:hypothetical protein